MRENVNQSVTEMGRLNVQKYILLDKNLRSDLEQLVLQRLSFDLSLAVNAQCHSNIVSIKQILRSYPWKNY